MKITSGVNEDVQLQRLRDILDAASDGVIERGKDLPELVTQVDAICASLMRAYDLVEQRCRHLTGENLSLETQLEEQVQLIQVLQEGIEYDEDLDHATADIMDAFLASGAAESSFDGEICFQPDVLFSKEDLKPIVRETIESWLRLKIR